MILESNAPIPSLFEIKPVHPQHFVLRVDDHELRFPSRHPREISRALWDPRHIGRFPDIDPRHRQVRRPTEAESGANQIWVSKLHSLPAEIKVLAKRLPATTMFGREDTIIAYASLKAAVTMLIIQYANAFRRSGIHAHIKINAATPWVHSC